MIVRLFDSSQDGNFGAVNYNDEKVEKNKGVLMSAHNFPKRIDVTKSEEVKTYLKNLTPYNSSFKNVQFHAVISTSGREHNKEELNNVAVDFMKNNGYENQPFIVVFHNDTKNNHVHIVSSNVDRLTRKQLVHSHTKLKAQIALKEAEKNILGINYEKKLESLMEFKFQNQNQLKKILEKNGFGIFEKDNNINITKNGVKIKSFPSNEINFSKEIDKSRAIQIAEILKKYSDLSNNKCFAIAENDMNSEWKCKLQSDLKTKFGFDIIFSFSDNKVPFGYTLIDNKNKNVFKGSDIVDMKNIFNFTDVKVEKQFFQFLENTNFKNDESKDAIKFYLETKFNLVVPDFLLDFGKKIPFSDYNANRSLINGFAKGNVESTLSFNMHYSTIKLGDNYFVVNEKDKYVFNINEMLNDKSFEQFQNRIHKNDNANSGTNSNNLKNLSEEPSKSLDVSNDSRLIQSLINSHSNVENGSEPFKKRRKRKSKR